MTTCTLLDTLRNSIVLNLLGALFSYPIKYFLLSYYHTMCCFHFVSSNSKSLWYHNMYDILFVSRDKKCLCDLRLRHVLGFSYIIACEFFHFFHGFTSHANILPFHGAVLDLVRTLKYATTIKIARISVKGSVTCSLFLLAMAASVLYLCQIISKV